MTKSIIYFLVLFFLGPTCTLSQPAREIKGGLNGRPTTRSEASLIQLIRKLFPEAEVKRDDSDVAEAPSGPALPHLYRVDGGINVFGRSSVISVNDLKETRDGKDTIVWLRIAAGEEDRADCKPCEREILAAFRLSKKNAELIDAANIQLYDRTDFDEQRPVLRISPAREAIVIWNRSQLSIANETFSVISVRHNRFDMLINRFDTYREYMCGSGYGEDARVRLLPSRRGGYRDIEVRVTTEVSHEINDGADNVTTLRRRFRYVYGWDVGRRKYRKVVDPHRQRLRLLKKLGPCGGASRVY